MRITEYPLGMNRYLYALANPATLIDPSGHFATMCDGGCGTSSPADDVQVRRAAQRSYVRETTGKKRNYSWTRRSSVLAFDLLHPLALVGGRR